MPEPLYKTQRNKSTGAVRDLVSHDGGETWQLDEGTQRDMEIDAQIESEGGIDKGSRLKTAQAAMDEAPQFAPPTDPAPHVVQLDPIAIEGDPSPAASPAVPLRAQPPPMPFQRAQSAPERPGMMGGSEAQSIGQRNPWELGDEAAGLGSALAAKVFGQTPRTAGRGIDAPLDQRSEYDVGRDSERALQKRALAERPADYRAGQTTQEALALAPSMFAAPFAAAPAAGAAAVAPTVARSFTTSATSAFPLGFVRGVGQSEAETVPEIVQEGNEQGLTESAFAGGLAAAAPAARAVKGAVRGTGDALARQASRMRGAASGVYGGKLADIVEKRGPQYPEQLGDAIERLGMKRRVGVPQSVGTYRQRAEQVAGELGDTISGSLDEFGNLNARASRQDVIDDLNQVLRGYEEGVTDSSQTKARAVARAIRRVSRGKTDDITPRELWDLKKSFEVEGGYKPGTVVNKRESAQAEANKDIATALRKRLQRTIDEQVTDPGLTDSYGRAMRDYGYAADVKTLAGKREAQELGNQIFSLPSAGYATAGAVLGTAQGGGPGAVMGAAGAVAANEAVKRYGKDTIADVARGASRMLGAPSPAASPLMSRASRAATPRPEARDFNVMPSLAARATSNANGSGMQQAAAEPQNRQATADQARGHELEGAVQRALQQNPQALGTYSARFLEALQSDDPAALGVELNKLRGDEEFTRRYLPQLRQMTQQVQR